MRRRRFFLIGGATAGVCLFGFALFAILERQVQHRLEDEFPADGFTQGKGREARSVRFSLGRRTVEFEGLKVAQPRGFGTGTVIRVRTLFLNFPFSTLFNPKVLRFRDVRFENAVVVLIRDDSGRWNLEAFSKSGALDSDRPEGAAGKGNDTSETTSTRSLATKAAWPLVVLDRVSGPLTVRIRDSQAVSELRDIRLRFEIAGTNLTTLPLPAEETQWGILTGKGKIEWSSGETPVAWTLRLGSGLFEGRVSFDFSVETGDLPKVLAAAFLGNTLDVTGRVERIRAAGEGVVRDGQFDESRSRIVFRLNGVRIGKRIVPELTIPVPIGGAVERPEFRLEPALAMLGAQLFEMELRERLTR